VDSVEMQIQVARLADAVDGLSLRMRDMQIDVKEIKVEVKKTNGRVNELERQAAIDEAVEQADQETQPLTLKRLAIYLAIIGGSIGGTIAVLEFFGKLS